MIKIQQALAFLSCRKESLRFYKIKNLRKGSKQEMDLGKLLYCTTQKENKRCEQEKTVNYGLSIEKHFEKLLNKLL